MINFIKNGINQKFSKYSFIDKDFKQALDNKVDIMKDFGKLLKLFLLEDKKQTILNF